jgi:hypothetical protein
MQRFKKLDVGLTGAEEGIEDAEYALRDGLQAHDEPAIRAALTQIRAHLAVIEDVGLDIDAARRALSVGDVQAAQKRLPRIRGTQEPLVEAWECSQEDYST